jgi:hypothetical protein
MVIEFSLVRNIKADKVFVFDWWTDLSPEDSKLVKPLKKREIISKEANLIVLRDEEELYFRRMKFLVKVTLERPNRWISEYDGKDATARSEYSLHEEKNRDQIVTTTLYYRTRIGPKGFFTNLFSPLVKPFVRRVFASEMKVFIRKLEEDYQNASSKLKS